MPDLEIKDLSLIENEFEISFSDLIPVQKGTTGRSLPIGKLTNFIKNNLVSPSLISETAREIVSGSNNSLFVDISHPNASDSRNNRGNTLEKPYRTIERALLEVARRSFRDGTTNDITNRYSIFVYPGEYDINNGYGGGGPDIAYNRYQDAANLIFLNKDWIVTEAYESVDIADQTPELLSELRKFATAVVDDIANFSNFNIVTAARSIKNELGELALYYQSAGNITVIQSALSVLIDRTITAVKGLAPVLPPGITLDPASTVNPCQNVQVTVNTLFGIVSQTILNNVNPWEIQVTRGSLRANFPTEGEPTNFNLQSFNSSYRCGVIVPRGVSLVFMSLRTTILRPTYVPPKDGSEGRGAIFRLTGDSFVTGSTVLDARGIFESHHNLHVYEYSTLQDLQDYYDKVSFVFRDDILWANLQDAANLADKNIDWVVRQTSLSSSVISGEPENQSLFLQSAPQLVKAIIKDLRLGGSSHVAKFAEEFLNAYVSGLDVALQPLVTGFFEGAFTSLGSYFAIAANNLANIYEGGVRDGRIASSNPAVEGRINTLFLIATSIIAGDTPPSLVPEVFSVGDTEVVKGENQIVGSVLGGIIQDTTQNASAYVFSTTLRSDYGMCGAYIDGSAVTGYKSFLAAQYTIVSYQNDPGAFIGTVGEGDVANKRYRGTKSTDVLDWRSFGFAFVNESYGQLVSCFNIGPALHYWADDGSDISIANSYSNMGDISMLAQGFRGQHGNGGAYPQDTNYIWSSIIRPKPIPRTGGAVLTLPIGNIASVTANSIILASPISFESLGAYTLKAGTNIYLDLGGVEAFATIAAPGVNASTLDKTVIPISAFSSNFPAANAQLLYIKRVQDNRPLKDRVFRVRVAAPLLGRGKPEEHFIFRLKFAVHALQLPLEQNKVFYVANVEDLGEGFYALALLEAYKDAEGGQDSFEDATVRADTDFEPDSLVINELGVGNPSYNAFTNLLEALNFPQITIDQALAVGSLGNEEFVLPSTYTVEFNKPSIIRGSHTWEFVGYLNPSTAFPQAQVTRLGTGLSETDALKKQISKLFTQKKGGRVYATGIDEKGFVYIGETRFNTRTGQQDNLRVLTSPGGSSSQGQQGQQGEPGPQGQTGPAGVGIVGASISNGNLILNLSNGGVINAGALPTSSNRLRNAQVSPVSGNPFGVGVYPLNTPIPTFVFPIDFLQIGETVEGMCDGFAQVDQTFRLFVTARARLARLGDGSYRLTRLFSPASEGLFNDTQFIPENYIQIEFLLEPAPATSTFFGFFNF